MMRRNPIQQKTIFHQVLSYLPALFIPLIMGGILYTCSMHAVREKAETIQYMMLADRADTLTELFDKISEITVMIQGNRNVSRLSGSSEWSSEEKYLLGDVQKFLAEYTVNNEELDEILLYFPDKECVLGTNSAFYLSSAKVLQSKTGLDQDEWYKLLSGNLYGAFHIVKNERLLYTSVYRKDIHFLKQPMIVMLYLSDQHMDYLLHTQEVEFFLTDQTEGHESDPSCYTSLSYRNGVKEAGNEKKVMAEEAWKLSFEDGPMQWIGPVCIYKNGLSGYPLTLYSIQPDVGYVSSLRGMKLLLAVYLVACLLAGVLLVWYQAGRNYRPVDEMLTLIRRYGYPDAKELPQARQSLQNLIEAYESKKDELSRQEQLIVTHSLHQLFEPEGTGMSAGDQAAYGLVCRLLGGEVCQVAQLSIVGAEETGLESSLRFFMLRNVLAEALEGKASFVFGELEENYYLLTGEWEGSGGAEPEEVMEEISRFFKERCGIDVSVEISGVHKGWEEIPIAFDEVRTLAEYRGFLTGYPRVLRYSGQGEDGLPEELFRIFSLERTMRRKLWEHQVEGLDKNLLLYKKYLDSESLRRWRGLGTEAQEQEETAGYIVDQVQSYIEEHYADKQLTAGALAEMFDVSAPWLSRSFKKEKGCGVLEYIGQIRMEKAKELLCTGLTVTETAERVGYYSSRPLIRLFTEKVGMTPAKYAKSQGSRGN